MNAKSNAIAIPTRTSSDLAQLEDLEKILMTNEADLEVLDDPEEMSKQIIAQILGAETDDELESFGEAIPWGQHLGIPFRVKGFQWRPSDYEEGSAIYFVVRAEKLLDDDGAILETPEPVVLTTGSRFVLAQLANMARRGTLVDSIREMTKPDKPTRGGFYPLRLRTPAAFKPTTTAEAA